MPQISKAFVSPDVGLAIHRGGQFIVADPVFHRLANVPYPEIVTQEDLLSFSLLPEGWQQMCERHYKMRLTQPYAVPVNGLWYQVAPQNLPGGLRVVFVTAISEKTHIKLLPDFRTAVL
jgi:hypothetical protein